MIPFTKYQHRYPLKLSVEVVDFRMAKKLMPDLAKAAQGK